MKTQSEIQNRIDFYKEQWAICVKEEMWQAAGVYNAQIEALEWVLRK